MTLPWAKYRTPPWTGFVARLDVPYLVSSGALSLKPAVLGLKANDSFQHLQQRISGLENGIADRRELYNEAVNLNNVRIEQFPDVILARMFAFQAAELLVFSDAEKADVDLKSLFG